MANLVRRQNTFNELFDLRSSFDHLFDKVANHSAGAEDQGAKLIFAVPQSRPGSTTTKRNTGIDPKEVELMTTLLVQKGNGVENEAQLSFLRAHRCDEIQEYYFSKRLPVAEVSKK